MAIRRNIGGRYVEVREKNTNKGHKGTIIKKWSSKQKHEKKIKKRNENKLNKWDWLLISIVIIILVWFAYVFFY